MKFYGFWNRLVLCLFSLIFIVLASMAGTARAQTASATSLSVASACPQAGCIVTLTATVTAGATKVSPGLVVFCDGGTVNCQYQAPLGHAQLAANGTASVRITLQPGTHELHAFFDGTRMFHGSSSSTQSLVVTPTAADKASVTTIAAIGSNGGDQLSTTVSGLGPRSPVGMVSFVDTSNNNSVLASVPLAKGVTSLSYAAGGLDVSKVPPALVSSVRTAATGDFNNDGFQDIVYTTFSNGMGVLLGDGRGGFTSDPIATGVSNGVLVVADINGDGNLDIVTGYGSSGISVYLGKGDGTFPHTINSASALPGNCTNVADFNHDGIPDLLCADSDAPTGNELVALIGKGDGTFTEMTPFQIEEETLVPGMIADFNGDGNQDVIALDSYSGDVVLFLGKGDGNFGPAIYTGIAAAFLGGGDFDGDGIPDLISASFTTSTFLHGNGDGTFTKKSSVTVAQSTGYSNADILAMTVGDFNGDGLLDVGYEVIFNDTGTNPSTFETFLNNGSGSFIAGATFTALEEEPVIAMADFTSDGIPDALVFNSTLAEAPSAFTGVEITTAAASSAPGLLLNGVGAHNVIASFPGDTNFNSSMSTPLSLPGTAVNYPAGFSNTSPLKLNGAASLQGNVLELTDGKQFEAGSFFNSTRVPVVAFSTSFDFQLNNATADGFAFVIQNGGPDALGSPGGGLGYGNPPAAAGPSISNSVAIAFDLHNNQGEGNNSVRLEFDGMTSASFNGQYPSNATDLTPSGIDLHSGHRFHAEITYTGSYLHLTITDLQMNKVFSGTLPAASTPINLTQYFGGSMAYVGFTGGTGVGTAIQTIYDWKFTPTAYTNHSYVSPNYPDGFVGATGLHFNGGAALSGSTIQLTHESSFEATSVYFTPEVKPQVTPYSAEFHTDFDFQVEDGEGDGFTFVLQNQGINAVGSSGGGLGYGPDKPGGAGYKIANSMAIKFDLHNNAGEGINSTGFYVNGASPTTPSVDLTPSGIDLHSGHIFHANIANITEGFYSYLTLTITDLTVYKVFTTTFMIRSSDVPPVAYAGFTAGTGATPSTIGVRNWTWTEY